MALTSGQQRVRNRIVRIGRQRRASPKEIKAAIETGLVESNLSNPSGGDADSAGWRQERASIYKDPTNLDASINRFYDETGRVADKYSRAGDLAAAVQRPAAQYRGRYQEASSRAQSLMGGSTGTGTMTQADVGRRTITTPGTDNSAARASLIQSFLDDRNSDPVDFALGIRGLQDAPATSRTVGGSSPSIAGAASVGSATQRANAIDAQRLPYKWGGGHGGQTPIDQAVPLDCSGAVSKVLGIDPRVSGDFGKWGSPGDGGSKGVTVYSNGHHVLMKINGHFFGTSATNPKGGAGWIPQDAISPQYLQGFTVRHSSKQ